MRDWQPCAAVSVGVRHWARFAQLIPNLRCVLVVCRIGVVPVGFPTLHWFYGCHAERILVGKADFRVVASLFILLPPSEGKAEGGAAATKWRESSGVFGKQLAAQRKMLVDQLTKSKGGDEKLLGVSKAHLARAKSANLSLRGAPTLPAYERYTGVVWDHLDLATLTSPQHARALNSIVVISGLLGAVSASDPTPDYRLKMGARFAPFGLLSKWWHDSLSETLNKAFKGSVVIDLLPQEHRASFTLDTDLVGEYFVVGLHEKTGKAGGHDAKAAKGRLARHIITECTTASKALPSLKSFRDPRFVVKIEK